MGDLVGGAVFTVAVVAGACVLAGTAVGAAAGAATAPANAAATTLTAAEAVLPAKAGSNPRVFMNSVSCASAGNCTAVGAYDDSSRHQQGLLLTQTAGTWTRGVKPPLPASAGSNPGTNVYSVSCASAGNCTAVGGYDDSSRHQQGLLLTQTSGTWTAVKAPLPAGAAANPQALVKSVSCASARNCTATGFYANRSGGFRALVLTKTSGTWTAARAPVPAGAAANPDDFLGAVSCTSAGNCAATGDYLDRLGRDQGLLLTKTSGTWTAVKAPLPAGTVFDPFADVNSVSCTSAGNCTATGTYSDNSDHRQGLLLTQTAGTWAAVQAPLPAHPRFNPNVILNSVSCTSAGNCTAVGGYLDSSNHSPGLLLTQTAGTWAAARPPLPAGAASDPGAGVFSVSCASAGNCTAVGGYTDSSGKEQGLVLTRTAGTWAAARAPLPANAGSNPRAGLGAVSCASAGNCTATGGYTDSSGARQGLLVTQRRTAA